MKNIFRLFATVAMVAALATSCSKTESTGPIDPPTPPTPVLTPGTLDIRFRCGGDLTKIADMKFELSYKDGESTQTKSFTDADLVAKESSYTDPVWGVISFDHELVVSVPMATLPSSATYGITFTTKEGADTASTARYNVSRALTFTYKGKNGDTVSTSTFDTSRTLGVRGNKLDELMTRLSNIYSAQEYTIKEDGELK